MKKFLALFAVLALTMVSSAAFAEVSVSGSIDIRNLSTNNASDMNSDKSDENRTTQERIRINVDAKHEGVKGRVTLENDWYVWGSATNGWAGSAVESKSGALTIREGWIDFSMPFGMPGHVKVGHQMLQLGNGWFFRANKYGSDAWLIGFPGKNTFAFVDVKAAEGLNAGSDDVDAYVLLDTYKIDDKSSVGAYFVRVMDRQGKFMAGGGADAEGTLDTIGLHYNGMVGPLKLAAEFDMQSGEADPGAGAATTDLSGKQIIVQASMPLDALTINATFAMGSGDDATTAEEEGITVALDKDPHYTFVYEYFTKTAAGATNTGFANTTAMNLGASYKVSGNVTVALDYWMLTATEVGAGVDDEVGSEIDAKILWKLNDNLSWNWSLGRFMPGKFYGANPDDVDAVQGILSYKF
ncbi:MAG: porin [Nitrospirota bacterium]|nr:porin [Nitrospirota bacterium]